MSLVLVAAYWPALRGGFIWSDVSFITGNEMMHAPDGLYRFWFTTQAADYWPVTATTFWFEWKLWGSHAVGYHATNLLLHGANVWMLWLVLRRVGLTVAAAAVAAAWFALHPVNVQSVAWIVERKNLLAMFFYLASIQFFLISFDRSGRRAHGFYGASLAAFILGMLSKGSIAMLPLVLTGLIAWKRPLARRDVRLLAPFFAAAVFLTAVNVWFQGHHLAEPIRQASPLVRLLGAGAVVWFYLGKALVPAGLCFVYPQWQITASSALWWLPALAAIVVTAVLGALSRRGAVRAARLILPVWLYFCVSLVPVMGFTDVYFMKFSLVADHYQQLALLGIAGAVGALWQNWQGPPLTIRAGFAVVVLLGLAVLTWRQSRDYSDAETLFTTTLRHNPGSWMAYNNRGILRAAAGRLPGAIDDFQAALRLKPDYADAYVDLGNAFGESGRPDEAIAQFRQALAVDPRRMEARENLALTEMSVGRPEQAIVDLKELVRLAPNNSTARVNLGAALAAVGRYREAETEDREAVRLAPALARPNFNLGNVLAREERFAEAIPFYERALQSAPENLAAHHNLAVALERVGRSDDAETQYRIEARLRAESPHR